MEESHSGLVRYPAKVVVFGSMGSNPISSATQLHTWRGQPRADGGSCLENSLIT